MISLDSLVSSHIVYSCWRGDLKQLKARIINHLTYTQYHSYDYYVFVDEDKPGDFQRVRTAEYQDWPIKWVMITYPQHMTTTASGKPLPGWLKALGLQYLTQRRRGHHHNNNHTHDDELILYLDIDCVIHSINVTLDSIVEGKSNHSIFIQEVHKDRFTIQDHSILLRNNNYTATFASDWIQAFNTCPNNWQEQGAYFNTVMVRVMEYAKTINTSLPNYPCFTKCVAKDHGGPFYHLWVCMQEYTSKHLLPPSPQHRIEHPDLYFFTRVLSTEFVSPRDGYTVSDMDESNPAPLACIGPLVVHLKMLKSGNVLYFPQQCPSKVKQFNPSIRLA